MLAKADGQDCLRRQIRRRTPTDVVGCQAGGVAGRLVPVGVLGYRGRCPG